jgi:hypothetical protein
MRRGLPLLVLMSAFVAMLALPGAVESTSARAAADFTVQVSGPQTVSINPCCVPPKFPYTFTFAYVGPALSPPPNDARTGFTIRLSEFTHSMEVEWAGMPGVTDCQTQTGPSDSFGPLWTEYSCTLIFTQGQTSMTMTGRVRPSGKIGAGTVSVTLSTGESASATTEFVRPSQPPPPPPPASQAPTPIPGPAAAPAKTITETFTSPGETESESVQISPTAKTAQIALTFPAGSSFDVTGIQLVPSQTGRTLAAAERRTRLKVSKRRTATSLDVRIRRLKPGRLKFKIVAKRLDGRTRVTARVRQSKRT